jgi:hypothetical protein
MKRQVPTEREMTHMIATAFERLPAPDARRLAAIEQQLLEQPRLRGRSKFVWWWLVGALLAGAASALWWVVDYDSGMEQKALPPSVNSTPIAPSASDPATRPSRTEGAESTLTDEQDRKNGPVIYQRER